MDSVPKAPETTKMNYNHRSNTDDEELSDSNSDNDFSSKRMRGDSDEGVYEEVSDSGTDDKDQLNRMNDVGVVDVTYAQRTVWLVKVNFTIF